MEYTLSAKQSEQLGILEKLVHDYGINLHVNEPMPEVKEPVSLDIEHDEAGGYVGIGAYINSTNSHYWWTDPVSLDSCYFSSFSLIGHNLVSDLDVMRFWGFKVDDNQIIHDTMLVGHILDSSLKSYGLKDMSARDLQIAYPSYDEIVGKRTAKQSTPRITLDKQPPRLTQLYNCLDCYVPAKLMERQLNGISTRVF